jgi:hypothetical protein
MSRDDTYLVDILESAKIALDYVSGKSWAEFNEDIQSLIEELAKIVPPE